MNRDSLFLMLAVGTVIMIIYYALTDFPDSVVIDVDGQPIVAKYEWPFPDVPYLVIEKEYKGHRLTEILVSETFTIRDLYSIRRDIDLRITTDTCIIENIEITGRKIICIKKLIKNE